MKRNNRYFKETLIRREVIGDEGRTYSYELVMKENEKLSGYKMPLYSIKVGLSDESGVKTEAEVKELFADPGKALLFFDKLVRNLATPIDTAYIIEDELAR